MFPIISLSAALQAMVSIEIRSPTVQKKKENNKKSKNDSFCSGGTSLFYFTTCMKIKQFIMVFSLIFVVMPQ